MINLLLPWHEGFWELYHSKLPINWLEKSQQNSGVTYLAPDPITGSLNFISCLKEYYERESEIQTWIEQSMVDPYADPFANWTPFQEFDSVDAEEELII